MFNKNNIKLLKLKFSRKQLGADIFGAYKSAFHGTGMEFAEHREYIPGDDIKHIDWKVSAKTNKIYIKKYDEERNLNILFVIDLNISFFYFNSKLELLEETFFILGASALNNSDNISALIKDKFHQPSKSIYFLGKILEEINKLEDIKYLNSNIDYLVEKIKYIKNHVIFILTDNTEIDVKKLKKLQLNKNEIIYINIFDYFENNLDSLEKDFEFEDGEDILTINLKDIQGIEKFRSIRRGQISYLENELKKNQIGYLYLDTSLDPFKELLNFFLQRNYR